MATLTAQDFATTGLEATYSSADAGGDVVANDGKVILHVKNDDGTDKEVTITAQETSRTVSGYGTATFSDVVVTVTAGEERFIGPFPIKTYNNASNQIAITYDAVTSVTIAALQMA